MAYTSQIRAQQSPVASDSALFEAFLTAYNSGSYESLLEYMTARHPQDSLAKAQSRAGYFHGLFREYGRLCVFSQTPETHASKWWLWAPVMGTWVGIQLAFTDDGRRYIDWVGVDRGILPPAFPRGEPLDRSSIAAHLNQYLETVGQKGHFSGVVAVAHEGQPAFLGAAGTADRRHSVPNHVDTRFDIASVGKLFTAIAVLQLVEQGRLSLDDSLERLISEYPDHIANQVTVRHLLTHTSGIELDDYGPFNEAVRHATSGTELLDAQLQHIEHMNREYEDFALPDDYDYTNEGFDLLGIMVERVTGMPWEEYLRRHVFAPAGMHHTGFDFRQAPAHLATGYTDRTTAPGEPLHDASWLKPPYARPSGGMYSTAGDLVRFGFAVMTGSLLQPKTFDRAIESGLTLIEKEGLAFGYGLGFEVDRIVGTVRVGHSGGSPGASARLDMYPASGTAVVVLSNLENAGHRVADHISHLLTGNGRVRPRALDKGPDAGDRCPGGATPRN